MLYSLSFAARLGIDAVIESQHKATSEAARGDVLFVDDDPEVLRTLGRIARSAGYETVCVGDAAQAAVLLSLRRFDAIVSDLRLPMTTGGVFATHAALLAPEAPLIVFTAAQDLREVWDLLQGTRVQSIIPKSGCDDRALLRALERAVAAGNHVAKSGQSARLIADGLVRALALRDVETEGHSRRVAAWTLLLVQRLGMPDTDWLDAELGGLLHDIGKIGIPDAILRKPGQLSAEEWVEMRRHPELGCTILAGIPALRGAHEIVRSHHERWDGTGYPDGLAGNAIPTRARVFALVDTYDAVTCDRPYRGGRSHSEAVALIQGESATQFDPMMVTAFAAVPEWEWVRVAQVFADQGADVRR